MKRILLTLIGALLAGSNIHAQVTLTQSSYPVSVVGTDSLKKTTFDSPFPVLSTVIGSLWDMSVVSDTSPVYFDYRVSSSPHPFADSNVYSFASYNYSGNAQCDISSIAILEYGVDVQLTKYSLTILTAGSDDSLFIPEQNSIYSSTRIKIAFPSTYSSSWTSTYRADLIYELSYAAYSLNHEPGIVRTYTTEQDTVTSYGQMRVKDLAGSPSLYFDVLQVQTIKTTVDSFFLGGVPMSSTLLSLLSLTQAKKDTIYEQNYYRTGEVTPLAQVTFHDAAFTQPYKAVTHAQRLEKLVIADAANESGIRIYPNPVTGEVVSITLPNKAGIWSYELINSAGRVVCSGLLQHQNGTAQLIIPASAIPGAYNLRIINDHTLFCTQPVEVTR